MRLRFSILVFVLSALVFAASDAPTKPAELALKNTQGVEQKLSDYRGKVVALNFWATWCGPCKDEMPLFVEAQKKYGDRLVVIAVTLDDPKASKKVTKFVKKYKMDFPVWVDATTDHMEPLGLGIALPATAFIDKDGTVVSRVLGQIKPQELNERLEWLMSDRKSPAPAALVDNLGSITQASGVRLSADTCDKPSAPKLKKSVDPIPPRSWGVKPNRARVIVEVTITKEGFVRDAVVISTSDLDAEHQALLAIKEWQFEPARCGKLPIEHKQKIELVIQQ